MAVRRRQPSARSVEDPRPPPPPSRPSPGHWCEIPCRAPGVCTGVRRPVRASGSGLGPEPSAAATSRQPPDGRSPSERSRVGAVLRDRLAASGPAGETDPRRPGGRFGSTGGSSGRGGSRRKLEEAEAPQVAGVSGGSCAPSWASRPAASTNASMSIRPLSRIPMTSCSRRQSEVGSYPPGGETNPPRAPSVDSCHDSNLLRPRISGPRPAASRGVRRVRQGRARTRRRHRHELRPAPRLPAAARVDRRPPRRPCRARDGHERLAPGVQLHRPPPRPGGHEGVRGGPVLRPLAPDPAAPRRRGRGRSATDEGSTWTRSTRRSAEFGPEPRLHDPDLPEPERPDALRAEPAPPARGRALARRDGPRGRPLRPPPLRRRVTATADRALGGDGVMFLPRSRRRLPRGSASATRSFPRSSWAPCRRSCSRTTSRR